MTKRAMQSWFAKAWSLDIVLISSSRTCIKFYNVSNKQTQICSFHLQSKFILHFCTKTNTQLKALKEYAVFYLRQYIFCFIFELYDVKVQLMEHFRDISLVDVGSGAVFGHRYDDSVATWRAAHPVNALSKKTWQGVEYFVERSNNPSNVSSDLNFCLISR